MVVSEVQRATVLAIDTAGNQMGCALLAHDRLLGEHMLEEPFGAPALLVPLIGRLMTETGLSGQDITLIAVNVGPGSFTGLRAGIAAAQGLSLAWQCRLVGISSFQALAHGWRRVRNSAPPDRLAILLDSRRDEPYAAVLDRDLAFLAPPFVLPEVERAAWRADEPTLLSDSAALAPCAVPHSAQDIAWLARDPCYHLPAKPVYLRPPAIGGQTK
ncbi:MAG TPA: tRNA (adenosine(37)-N6)-threonylcarbamoyltransferase complex dimerization subunit type 1 TsaB [Dongiaceae bacterium]|jgi:tRNA threonylcarbamoyladenosine biosynthesis protein TsaB|nr:tRNA (adenosine(37)-N6)-threonylcarbamoyltransferase complex dimerization subunit type 1 TsaB [Dongiaceae bacterium]